MESMQPNGVTTINEDLNELLFALEVKQYFLLGLFLPADQVSPLFPLLIYLTASRPHLCVRLLFLQGRIKPG